MQLQTAEHLNSNPNTLILPTTTLRVRTRKLQVIKTLQQRVQINIPSANELPLQKNASHCFNKFCWESTQMNKHPKGLKSHLQCRIDYDATYWITIPFRLGSPRSSSWTLSSVKPLHLKAKQNFGLIDFWSECFLMFCLEVKSTLMRTSTVQFKFRILETFSAPGSSLFSQALRFFGRNEKFSGVNSLIARKRGGRGKVFNFMSSSSQLFGGIPSASHHQLQIFIFMICSQLLLVYVALSCRLLACEPSVWILIWCNEIVAIRSHEPSFNSVAFHYQFISGLHHAVSLGNIDAPTQVKIKLSAGNLAWPRMAKTCTISISLSLAVELQLGSKELRLGGWEHGKTERPSARPLQHKAVDLLEGGHHRPVLSNGPAVEQFHRSAEAGPILRMLVDAEPAIVPRRVRWASCTVGRKFTGLRSDKQASEVRKRRKQNN